MASRFYALLIVGEAILTAIVPLLPELSSRWALSATEAAALVAAPGVAMVMTSVPSGGLGDRFGARRLTLWGAALIAACSLAQGVASSFEALCATRLLLGFALGIIWTAGSSWLTQSMPAGEAPAALGKMVTSAGIGIVIGPVAGGLLASAFGTSAPFFAGGAVLTAIAVALARVPVVASTRSAAAAASSLQTLRAALRATPIVAAGAALALSGGLGGGLSVIAPLQLGAAGMSEADIGLAFGAAAGLFIGGSMIAVRLGDRLGTTRALGIASVVLIGTLIPATVSAHTVAILGTVCLAAGIRALTSTASYPLAAAAADRLALGRATIMGLLNSVWAASTVAGPAVAGAAVDLLGVAASYATLQAVIAIGIVAVVLHGRLFGGAAPQV
jgi:predicted MFS family arabinose efflux permease